MQLVGMENYGFCFIHVLESEGLETSLIQLNSSILHEICHQWLGNFVGMSFALKEGLVQHVEKTLKEKVFGKGFEKQRRNYKKTSITANYSLARFTSISSKDSQSESLVKLMSSEMNEEVYKLCLKKIEAITEKTEENILQQRLNSLFHAFPNKYLEDSELLNCLVGSHNNNK